MRVGNSTFTLIILFVSVIALMSCSSKTDVDINYTTSGCEEVSSTDYNHDPAKSDIASKTVDLRELPCFWFNTKEGDYQQKELFLSQEFANRAFPYAIAAYDVYQKDTGSFEDIPFPPNEDWKQIVYQQSISDTGFFAKSRIRVTKDGVRELVVSFRGTGKGSRDWTRGNLTFAKIFLFDNQFENAVDFTHESIRLAKDTGGYQRIIFVGHSLGGGLAQYAQRHFKDTNAYVFNSSPNRGRIYSIFDWLTGKLEPMNATRLTERGEVLNYFRTAMDFHPSGGGSPDTIGKKTRWMEFYKGNPIGQHDMQDFAINLVKVAASSDDSRALLGSNNDALQIIEVLERKRTKEQLEHPYYDLRSPNNDKRKALRQKVLQSL